MYLINWIRLVFVLTTLRRASSTFVKSPSKPTLVALSSTAILTWKYQVPAGKMLLVVNFEKKAKAGESFDSIGQIVMAVSPPQTFVYIFPGRIKLSLPSTLTIQGVTKDDLGVYRCKLQFADSTMESDETTLQEVDGGNSILTSSVQATKYVSSMKTILTSSSRNRGTWITSMASVFVQRSLYLIEEIRSTSIQSTPILVTSTSLFLSQTKTIDSTKHLASFSPRVRIAINATGMSDKISHVTPIDIKSRHQFNSMKELLTFTPQMISSSKTKISIGSSSQRASQKPAISRHLQTVQTSFSQKSSLFNISRAASSSLTTSSRPQISLIPSEVLQPTRMNTKKPLSDENRNAIKIILVIAIPTVIFVLSGIGFLVLLIKVKRKKTKVKALVFPNIELELKQYI